MYGHLSTAPQSFLKEMLLYTYRRVDTRGADIPPLGEVRAVKLRRLVFNLAKQGTLPMRLKWFAEKYVEPRLESCPVSRNQALGEGEACLVSRNHPMHDSVRYLKNALDDETELSTSTFVPREPARRLRRWVARGDHDPQGESPERVGCASCTARTTCSRTRRPTCSRWCST